MLEFFYYLKRSTLNHQYGVCLSCLNTLVLINQNSPNKLLKMFNILSELILLTTSVRIANKV